MTQSKNSVGIPAKNPTRYVGPKASLVPIVKFSREPLPTDENYPIGQQWIIGLNPTTGSTGDLYYLCEFVAGAAVWCQFDKAVGGPGVDTLRDQVNVTVNPNATGEIDIDGLTVNNGTNPSGIPVETVAGTNVLTIQTQVAAAVAPTPANKNDAGICSFDEDIFTVDGNGFVTINGGGTPLVDGIDVDFNTAPGTDPVLADANGLISIWGNVVPNATNASAPVATHSRAANQLHVDVQLATERTGAPGDNDDVGLCSFDDTAFAVDANGYVTSIGGSSAGGIVYLATATASNSATLEFTTLIDATYNTYLFIFDNIAPVADGPSLRMRTSSDGGVSYDSTASDYKASAGVSSTTITISSVGIGNAANEDGSGYLIMHDPSATKYTFINSVFSCTDQSGNIGWQTTGGSRNSTTAVNAIEFYMSTGNINTGSIRMYGMTTPA